MNTAPAPSTRRWAAILLAVAAVALLPAVLAMLAPPPLANQGPVFDAATREGCTAALDRMERLLAGALDVQLLEPACTGLATPQAPRGLAAQHAQTRACLPLVARPSETARTL